jgi:hypothetical protein
MNPSDGKEISMPGDDLRAARDVLADLRRVVLRLQSHYGDTVDLHRLRDDVARAASDLELLARSVPRGTGGGTPAEGEVVYITDDDYGSDFWADADDEGLGAHGRQ